jgi:hypothetical protein
VARNRSVAVPWQVRSSRAGRLFTGPKILLYNELVSQRLLIVGSGLEPRIRSL